MPCDYNQFQQLDMALHEKIVEWLTKYLKFAPSAYNTDGNLKIGSIKLGFITLIEQCVFDDAEEIKREFAKEYLSVLPNFLFEL